jgi:antitoxin VapB
MSTTRIFRSGNSLAVRLPRDIAFAEGAEVVVLRRGDSIMIRPARRNMAALVERLGALPHPGFVPRPDFRPPRRDRLPDLDD